MFLGRLLPGLRVQALPSISLSVGKQRNKENVSKDSEFVSLLVKSKQRVKGPRESSSCFSDAKTPSCQYRGGRRLRMTKAESSASPLG